MWHLVGSRIRSSAIAIAIAFTASTVPCLAQPAPAPPIDPKIQAGPNPWQIYPLKFAQATAVAEQLRHMRFGEVVADDRTNTIIFTPFVDVSEAEVTQHIELLDRPPQRHIEIIDTQSVDVVRVAASIASLYNVRVAAGLDEKAIVVVSERPEEIEALKAVLEELNVFSAKQQRAAVEPPATPVVEQVRIIWLTTAGMHSTIKQQPLDPSMEKIVAPLREYGLGELAVAGQFIVNVPESDSAMAFNCDGMVGPMNVHLEGTHEGNGSDGIPRLRLRLNVTQMGQGEKLACEACVRAKPGKRTVLAAVPYPEFDEQQNVVAQGQSVFIFEAIGDAETP
jgi:hypothetical protein